ncbi:MAG: T9SS type A sorting domain-containing protein [Saprospiraceae bacterium]|nr:T9SS type A sorting domain-containing protein [Saprospiraceae bacterium]
MKLKKIFLLITIVSLSTTYTITAQLSWRLAKSAPTFVRIDDISFINDSTAFIGQDGIIFKSTDYGNKWNQIGALPNYGYIRSIEFISDSVGFIGTIFEMNRQKGFYKTTDGGQTWIKINDLIPGGADGICGLDHLGNTIIGVGIYAEPGTFYISRNGGDTWDKKLIPESAALVDCLILDENTFLIAGNSPDKRKGNILKSQDGGETWQEVAKTRYPLSYVWKLHISESGLGLGSIENGTTSFITHDFGDTWEEVEISDEGQIKRFGGALFLDDLTGWLGLQSLSEAWETNDGGATWHTTVIGEAINKIVPMSNGRAIATGKSIYIYDDLISDSKEVYTTSQHQLVLSPNPTTGIIYADINLITQTSVRLDLMDITGNMILPLVRDEFTSGHHHLEFDISSIPKGTYIVWFRTNEAHQSAKIILK